MRQGTYLEASSEKTTNLEILYSTNNHPLYFMHFPICYRREIKGFTRTKTAKLRFDFPACNFQFQVFA